MSDISTKSIRICQEGHANALALNRECSQIAVAGRNILKVFSIENDGFTEVCNMRGGKNPNLSYSSNDVAWSTLDQNILATAATNGFVSVWDLSKFGRHKQLLIYNEHTRTAHTVTFHSTEQNLLLSASQDGTIKCFDLRTEKSVNTYFSNSESVRDVKFSPHSTNNFAAVSENGTVQLWDIRRSDKCSHLFTAHSGPIYTCDWHPAKNWLATGSRDKQIKVWNMELKASLEHTIHTIDVVGKVKWRPDRQHHIASCALVVDYSIHIWDIRRPYIPFASFNEHTNATTGIAWRGNDSHVLLSTSKDSTIYKHAFKDAARPSLKANPQGTSFNLKGDIAFALKIKVTAPSPSNSRTSFMPQKQKPPVKSEQFHLAQSNLYAFLLKSVHPGFSEDEDRIILRDYDCFIGCAKEYIFSGKKLSEICEHNSNVAKKYKRSNASFMWDFVKVSYALSNLTNQKSEQRSSLSNQNQLANRRLTQTANQLESNWNDKDKDEEDDDDIKQSQLDEQKLLEFISPISEDFKTCFNTNNGTQNAIKYEESQLSFKDLRDGFLYVGPHDLAKALSLPEAALHDLNKGIARPQPDMRSEQRQEPSPPPDPPSILRVTNIPVVPMFEPHESMAECLELLTDLGDVQTAVIILLALGENRNLLPLDDTIYENWLQSYVEMLHRHQLWNEATVIINQSWIRSVRELNQQSTTMHTNCGGCRRPLLGAVGWYCTKCKSSESSKCSVCNLAVRGLYAWCQGCSHGGHLEHIKQWFSSRSKCPKCGHLCEYD